MHEQFASLAADQVRFDLAGVVRNVEQQRQLAIGKEMPEDAPRIVAEDFAIGEGAVHRRPHGAEIASTDLRIDRRAGEFAVGKHNSRRLRGNHHVPGEFGADLMPEPPRAAMNSDDDTIQLQAERRGGRGSKISATICTSR